MDPAVAAHIAALQAKCDADKTWREEPCPACRRRPLTRDRETREPNRFLLGNYACRNPALGPHRHYRRKCEGCGDVRYRPELDDGCTFVGIG